jgi:hypothetical protein
VHNTRSLPLSTMICGCLCAAAVTSTAGATVTAGGPPGFIVRIELPVAAAPERVFDRFLQIGRWWSDEHTYSGRATNMRLDNRIGGCFCETLPGGGFVRHMEVVYSAPGKALRLAGALGPLQEMGASGLMSVQFRAEGAATRLVMTYIVSGFAPGAGYSEVASAVDGVMTEQLSRLKRFTETGKPAP